MALLAALEGRLVAIEGVREAQLDQELVKLSKAVFMVSFGVGRRVGTMIFWGEEMGTLMGLQLGQDYRFVAGLEVEQSLYLLYFFPGTTRFEKVVQRNCNSSEAEPNC